METPVGLILKKSTFYRGGKEVKWMKVRPRVSGGEGEHKRGGSLMEEIRGDQNCYSRLGEPLDEWER